MKQRVLNMFLCNILIMWFTESGGWNIWEASWSERNSDPHVAYQVNNSVYSSVVLSLLCSFYSRLESNFPCHLFEDIYTYSTNLGLASTESTPKEEDCMPSGGEVATKLNSLASSAYFCSSATDSFMSNLVVMVTNWSMIHVCLL